MTRRALLGSKSNTVAGDIERQFGIQQCVRNFHENYDISESVCSSFDLGPIFEPPLGQELSRSGPDVSGYAF